MRDEAKANEEADKAEKEKVDKINNADAMVFQTEKNLKEYGDKIPADKKTAIESACSELKKAVEAKDLNAIERYNSELEAAWHAASEDMAKAAQGGAQGPQGGGFNPGDGGFNPGGFGGGPQGGPQGGPGPDYGNGQPDEQ